MVPTSLRDYHWRTPHTGKLNKKVLWSVNKSVTDFFFGFGKSESSYAGIKKKTVMFDVINCTRATN